MKNSEIVKVFTYLQKVGLISGTKVNKTIVAKLGADPDGENGARLIVTLGEPEGYADCSECDRTLTWDMFGYYQTRVDGKGYLMRFNALCKDCREDQAKSRSAAIDNNPNVTPKPKSGEVCPRCDRPWTGRWHRDHDYQKSMFRGWICGQCNMSKHDRRTPDPKENEADTIQGELI